jgi:hypothetical protein
MIGSIVSGLPSSNLGAGARAFWRATEAAEVAFAGEIGGAGVDDHGLEAWREWQRGWDGQLDSELDKPFLSRHARAYIAIDPNSTSRSLSKETTSVASKLRPNPPTLRVPNPLMRLM